MEYFIGIVPPQETLKKIYTFQKSFTSNRLPDIIEPHITVKTKNGLTEDCRWLQTITHIIEEYPRFVITLKGVDMFRDSVVILRPEVSEELIGLHKILYQAIQPNESDPGKQFYENHYFEAHITLGMVSWGMTNEELLCMRERAVQELSHLPGFAVTFIRVYRQTQLTGPFNTFLDIPLL